MAGREFGGGGGGGGWFGGGHGGGEVGACVWVAGGEGGEGWWWVDLEHFFGLVRGRDGGVDERRWMVERVLMEREVRRVERVCGGER